jgi:hypothetical protein
VLAGGLLYIAGRFYHHRRWPDPYASVFGYREVFHVYSGVPPRPVPVRRDSAVRRLSLRD